MTDFDTPEIRPIEIRPIDTRPRVLIATPVDGDPIGAKVSHGYHHAVTHLVRDGALTIPATISFADDLARARSRCVWYALQAKEQWDWVLWWDEDVIVHDTAIVRRMISVAESNGWDMIGAPYPKKRIPSKFPYMPTKEAVLTGNMPVEDDCVEVDCLAFGFVLTSRDCLESMADQYKNDLWFSDNHDPNNLHKTVALFMPMFASDYHHERMLLSEDYSFCHRWRAMNGKIHMYLGEGSPLSHQGSHVFSGQKSEIGKL